jgi:hypothetical protein
MVWWGARNGRAVMTRGRAEGAPRRNAPRSSPGPRRGERGQESSRVDGPAWFFPLPGGPMSMMLCPPAAATSKGALGRSLTPHVGKVHRVPGAFGEELPRIASTRRASRGSRAGTRRSRPASPRRAPRCHQQPTPRRHWQPAAGGFVRRPHVGGDGQPQRAANRPEASLESQLTQHEGTAPAVRREPVHWPPGLPARSEGRMPSCPSGCSTGGEIHDAALDGNSRSRIDQGGVHALATLLHRRLGQADGRERRQP